MTDDARSHTTLNRTWLQASMSALKIVGQPHSAESKSNDLTRVVAPGVLAELATTLSIPNNKGEKLLDRTWWAWTTRSEYDWMDEHWPFNTRD